MVASSGDVFVTDAHRNGPNHRAAHFSKEGGIKEWRTKGKGRVGSASRCSIANGSRGPEFVGERENNRIHIFDQAGRLLDTRRPLGRPGGIAGTNDEHDLRG